MHFVDYNELWMTAALSSSTDRRGGVRRRRLTVTLTLQQQVVVEPAAADEAAQAGEGSTHALHVEPRLRRGHVRGRHSCPDP